MAYGYGNVETEGWGRAVRFLRAFAACVCWGVRCLVRGRCVQSFPGVRGEPVEEIIFFVFHFERFLGSWEETRNGEEIVSRDLRGYADAGGKYGMGGKL